MYNNQWFIIIIIIIIIMTRTVRLHPGSPGDITG